MLLLEADWLVLPGGKLEKGPVWVSVEGQEITAVFKDRAPPTTDYTIHHAHLIAPGFVDIHTHGVGESMIVFVDMCQVHLLYFHPLICRWKR